MLPQLPQWTLRLRGSGRVEDLRRCMKCLHKYWYHKGYWGVITTYLVNFCVAFIMLVVSFVFTMRFQWQTALNCTEADCASSALVQGISWPYIYRRNFLGHLFGVVVFVSNLVVCVYEGVRLVEARFIYGEVEELVRNADIDTGFLTPYHRWLYDRRRRRNELYEHEILSLRSGSRWLLSTMSWGDFIEHMCASLGQQQQLKSCASGTPLDVLRAMQSMLHTENYLISLYDSGVLTIGALNYTTPRTIAYLVSAMFDSFNTVLSVQHCVWSLRIHIVQYLFFYVVFYLFIVTYSLVKVLVKHAAQAKSNYRDFTRREWNYRAAWSFRLYNEVSHLHACRLASAGEVVHRMIRRLEVSGELSRLIRRTSSTCVLVVLVLSFMNPHLLIGGNLCGLTLMWWLTLALLAHTTFTEEDPREREYVYTNDLHTLVHTLHYSRAEWHESGEAFLSSMTRLFVRSRGCIIASDLLRAVFMPYILYRLLVDGSVEVLTTHVHSCSVFVEGVGSVAEGAVFFESPEREWEGRGADDAELCESAAGRAVTAESMNEMRKQHQQKQAGEDEERRRMLSAAGAEAQQGGADAAAFACSGNAHSNNHSKNHPVCVTDTAVVHSTDYRRAAPQDMRTISPDACSVGVLGDMAAPMSRTLAERVRMSVAAFSAAYPRWMSPRTLPKSEQGAMRMSTPTQNAKGTWTDIPGKTTQMGDDYAFFSFAPPGGGHRHERAPLLHPSTGLLLPMISDRFLCTPVRSSRPHDPSVQKNGSAHMHTVEVHRSTPNGRARIGQEGGHDRNTAGEESAHHSKTVQNTPCYSAHSGRCVLPTQGRAGYHVSQSSSSTNINNSSSYGVCPQANSYGAASDVATLTVSATHVRHMRECNHTHEEAKSLRTFLRHLDGSATRCVAEANAASSGISYSPAAASDPAVVSWQDDGQGGGVTADPMRGHASFAQTECSINHAHDDDQITDGVRCHADTNDDDDEYALIRHYRRQLGDGASRNICSSHTIVSDTDASDSGSGCVRKHACSMMCSTSACERPRLFASQVASPMLSACSRPASLLTSYGARTDTSNTGTRPRTL